MGKSVIKESIYDPGRWGLTEEFLIEISAILSNLYERFRRFFKTSTKDTSDYGLQYLRGILTMDKRRNYTNISRQAFDWQDDGQRIQHFMSDSPWETDGIFAQIQSEIKQEHMLQGGILTLDESGDVCSGGEKAGASRQHICRTGSVQEGQVGVVLGYYANEIWSMVDAELYLPPKWFDKEYRKKWRALHIPADRPFMTKPEIGLEQILRAKKQGLPFSAVTFDTLYGRNNNFRRRLECEGLTYVGDVPLDYMVYLEKPDVEKKRKYFKVMSETKYIKVSNLLKTAVFEPVELRHTERGLLKQGFSSRRVWTFDPEFGVREETLLIWREECGKIHYSLSNASADIALKELGLYRNLRHFAERIFEDVKSESGWADLEARKYRAWMHNTAINALALWYVAQVKMSFMQQRPKAPALAEELKVEVLPLLSMANVREMLKSTFIQHQLSPEESRHLVTLFLVNRSKSTASRLKKQHGKT